MSAGDAPLVSMFTTVELLANDTFLAMPWLSTPQIEIVARDTQGWFGGGGLLHVLGWNWTPDSDVSFFADDVPHKSQPLNVGFQRADSHGMIHIWLDIRCAEDDPSDPEYGKATMIRAEGLAGERASAGPTFLTSCTRG